MKLFLDANILFSAASRESATRKLFDLLIFHGHILLTSECAVEEARRNLELKKPQNLASLPCLLNDIKIIGLSIELTDLRMNENDKILVSSAVAAACDIFWTGDRRHFESYYGSEIRGVKVLSSIMVAELLIKD